MSEVSTTTTGPYDAHLFVNSDGHLIFEDNSEFKVTYTIDKDPASDTYGHLFVTYSVKI